MRFDARFSATSLWFDTAMDDRMGRRMAGYFGRGWLELGDAGLTVHARKHRYRANLAGGVVGAAAGMVLAVVVARDQHERVNPMFGFLGAVLFMFVTSLFFRFTARRTELVPWTHIERVALFGGDVRVFCQQGGDVQLGAGAEAWNALQHACYARGIRHQ